VGAGGAGTPGTPGATVSREVRARAAGTRDAPGAVLSREAGAGATGTRGAPRVALRREAGTGAQATRGDPGAVMSRETGTTPPPPLPRPSVGGSGVVVHVASSDNPHRMITWGQTAFMVVSARLVLTAVTSSSTPHRPCAPPRPACDSATAAAA
jgi:hypothetical protein